MVDDSTVKELVYSEELADRRGVKKLITSIISQYELFTESEGVVKENIKVIDDCTVTVYLKKYSQLHANSATKQCIMVRYPYMKIKHFTNGADRKSVV